MTTKRSPSDQRAIATDPTTLHVRVTPRGSRDALEGWRNGVLHVRLAAAPVEGKANVALIRLLAKTAGVAAGKVRIVSGERGRDKRLAFDGIEAGTLAARLGIPHDHDV